MSQLQRVLWGFLKIGVHFGVIMVLTKIFWLLIGLPPPIQGNKLMWAIQGYTKYLGCRGVVPER